MPICRAALRSAVALAQPPGAPLRSIVAHFESIAEHRRRFRRLSLEVAALIAVFLGGQIAADRRRRAGLANLRERFVEASRHYWRPAIRFLP